MTSGDEVEIGIFGGSGLYELLDAPTFRKVETPYGEPSDEVAVGILAGRSVAFLPRHGRGHRLPPHRVPYRANVWALASLGVTRLIAPCAVGSLQPEHGPGTFVVFDQFVDRTSGRADTFFDGAPVTHVSMADPYCPVMRELTIQELEDMGRPHTRTGTVVVVQGPRFSTRAESRWFGGQGWEAIGMTQYPEVPLARERALCVLGVGMVTDYDAGPADDPAVESVTSAAVLETFERNIVHVRALLERLVAAVPRDRGGCTCGTALEGAQL